jgi:hypothetical protein
MTDSTRRLRYACVFAVLLVPPGADASAQSTDAYRAAALAAWEQAAEVEAAAGGLRIDVRQTGTPPGGTLRADESAYTVFRKPGYAKVERDSGAYALNPDYAFIVTKGPSGDYRMGEFKQGPTAADAVSRRIPFRCEFLHPLTSLLDHQLSELVRANSFRFVRVQEGADGYVCDVQWDPPSSRSNAVRKTGVATFDRQWRLCDLVAKGAGAEFKFRQTYNLALSGGRTFSDRSELTMVENGGDLTRTITYAVAGAPVPPDAAFYLTHYGLPEPNGVTPPRRTSRVVWVLVAAGVSIVLMFGFRRLSRRAELASGQ